MMKTTHSLLSACCLLIAGCATPPAIHIPERSTAAAVHDGVASAPRMRTTRASVPSSATMPRGKPLKDVFVRVEAFHDTLEWDELKVDYDAAPEVTILDAERERTGMRVSFGPTMVGGYFQVFAEEFTSPTLLLPSMPSTTFDGFGLGAGVQGAPTVIDGSTVDMVIPFRYGFDVAGGVDDTGGFDNTWVYVESQLQAGVGARVFGLQPSVGFLLDSVFGVLDSDNPASPANSDAALVDGLNFGGYAEVLFKPTAVPLTASVRGVFGQNSGLFVSFGLAF